MNDRLEDCSGLRHRLKVSPFCAVFAVLDASQMELRERNPEAACHEQQAENGSGDIGVPVAFQHCMKNH